MEAVLYGWGLYKMKIAQISPLVESVPPVLYGGTERVVSYLTEELVRQGHEVTLFASGDSITDASLLSPCPTALRFDQSCQDPLAFITLMLDDVFQRISEFDVVHFHLDYLHLPLWRMHPCPAITTMHGRLDLKQLTPVYRRFREMPLVSISIAQRAPLEWANWRANVYHGLPLNLYRPSYESGKYLAYLGRIAPEKRPDFAIQIAIRAGIPLKIAAKIDRVDREYFEQQIEPLLENPLIEYIGEVTDGEKERFLGEALALLFPIDWPEPFGLVMIEAMACGTPVVAFRRGSVPEIVDHGATGYIVDNCDEAVKALRDISKLSRRTIRRCFEKRFSAERMALDYVALYQRVRSEAPNSQYSVTRCS
ncbi:MAG: glycosyltransferase family 4 protein [Bryobacteraceae bacterium]